MKVKSFLNRRWTQMDADGQGEIMLVEFLRTGVIVPKGAGKQHAPLICVHLRPSAVPLGFELK